MLQATDITGTNLSWILIVRDKNGVIHLQVPAENKSKAPNLFISR